MKGYMASNSQVAHHRHFAFAPKQNDCMKPNILLYARSSRYFNDAVRAWGCLWAFHTTRIVSNFQCTSVCLFNCFNEEPVRSARTGYISPKFAKKHTLWWTKEPFTRGTTHGDGFNLARLFNWNIFFEFRLFAMFATLSLVHVQLKHGLSKFLTS